MATDSDDEKVKSEFWELIEAYGEANLIAAFRKVEADVPIGFMKSMIDQMVGNHVKVPKVIGIAHSLKINTDLIVGSNANTINCMMLPIQLGVLIEWKEAFRDLSGLLINMVKMNLALVDELNSVNAVHEAITNILNLFSPAEIEAIEYLRNYYAHYHAESYFLSWDDDKKKLRDRRKGRDRRELRSDISAVLYFADNNIEKWASSISKRIQHLVGDLYKATVAWEKLSTVC